MNITTTLLDDNDSAFKIPHPLIGGRSLWLPKSRCSYRIENSASGCMPLNVLGPVGSSIIINIPDDLAKMMKLSTHFKASEKIITNSVPPMSEWPKQATEGIPGRDSSTRVSRNPGPKSQPTPVIANGTYTVEFPDGSHKTIKISAWDKRPGYQIAAYLFGPDNSIDFRGFASIAGTTASIWSSYRGAPDSPVIKALEVILADDDDKRFAAGEAYAVASGRCCKCQRTLTVPASIHRGMGPDCWEKYAPLDQLVKGLKETYDRIKES